MQRPVPGVAHQRAEQPVRVVDLLVGDHPWGRAQLVDVVVAGLDPDHPALGHPEVHAALDAAEAAVGRDQPLAGRGGLPVGGRLGPAGAAEVADPGGDHRVGMSLT